MNSDIKISVIMPIYNAYDYLRPAIDSVLSQTLSDIEIICVDDGSTDKSLEVLKEYQGRDERVRILSETNAGPAAARNRGLAKARGEFVAFLDADDFFEPDFLKKTYELAVSSELDIAITGYDVYNTKKASFSPGIDGEHSAIYAGGRITSKSEFPDEILESTIGAPWNKIFRKSFIESLEIGFLEEVRMYEDVYFIVTALALANRVGRVEEILVHHRLHSEQTRVKLFGKYFSHIPKVYLAIKEYLTSHGIFVPLRKSFVNHSASRCYKIFNLLPRDAKGEFYTLLHKEYAESLGWTGREASEFELPEVFDFVANLSVYDYAEYKRRISKGKEQSFSDSDSIKSAKKKQRFRDFFARLFGKKK